MATIDPISAIANPLLANSKGSMPQIIPSFKLLVSPAWVIDPKFGCFHVVEAKTLPSGFTEEAICSETTWGAVSLTSNQLLIRPRTENPIPK